MNIEYIYNSVKDFVENRYGTRRWCYTDYFLDENGRNYFTEQIEADEEILPDWDDDDIIEHICNSISANMFTYEYAKQQDMLLY